LQSAAVLGLSRLVFEFAGQLEGVVGRLLPAVLLLLRSHSREVIKAVLGFIKVGGAAGVLGPWTACVGHMRCAVALLECHSKCLMNVTCVVYHAVYASRRCVQDL
jgi:hypothetical protein